MKKRLSRREFLKIATVVSLAGGGGGLLAPPIREARGDVKKHHKGKDELRKALEDVLRYKVRGMERNNQIPGRLANNLARIGGRFPQIVEDRRRLLLRAAEDVGDDQKSGAHGEKRTVTQNLNDLLNTVRAQPASSSFMQSLVNALIVTVLFATHGIHFEDTREAHRQFRQALLALKNRAATVPPIGTRITNKRHLLEIYRRTIASRRRQISSGGHFPEGVTMASVWIMPRSIEN